MDTWEPWEWPRTLSEVLMPGDRSGRASSMQFYPCSGSASTLPPWISRVSEALAFQRFMASGTELPPRVRDRLEMVLLSSVAWAPSRIASHLGCCTANVQKDFLSRGVAAL